MAAAEEEEEQHIQARIECALYSRLPYFKENDSTITMVNVRRLLEEDLGFEKYALDVHKKFIKQFIEKHLYNDDSGFKNSEEDVCKCSVSTVGKAMESSKKHEKDKEPRGPTPKHEPNMEDDSPIMGLLTSNAEGPQAIETSESTIKKAIWERADHIRANSEALTLAGARQLLEEDLGLHENALEPFKKFIRKQIEEVLDPPVVSKSVTRPKKEGYEFCPSGEGRSRPKDRQNNEVEDPAETREKTMQISKEKSNRLKRCRTENELDHSSKKSKIVKKQAEDNIAAESDGGESEDGGSQSSVEKPAKKKPLSTPVYGKHVEHLKSVIKACGMSVPPSVYKKAKQVPDNKRESFLTKELEDILSREGLSSNPTEKEIKEIRKRKERAKELEGIDISNIVTSSRRRSTSSFMVHPARETQGDGRHNVKGTKDSKVRNSDSDNDGEDCSKNEEKSKEGGGGGGGEEDDEEEEYDDDDSENEEEEYDDDDSENEDFNEDDNDSD